MKKILFNNISYYPEYGDGFQKLLSNYELIRSKYYSKNCLALLKQTYNTSELFLTHSATGALELIATLIDIKPGDEVIMPSFTFVSTANAFASKGATPVFIDIDKETLNIDCNLIEGAISKNTKAIIAMHYAGNACDMDALKSLCEKHGLYLIEDAAMGFGNTYFNKPLGTIGDFGVISFDITKQINAIQGGLILVNNQDLIERAHHIYHIGTNKTDFEKKDVPYYEWVDFGSKFQMNELNALVLFEQLKQEKEILGYRKKIASCYYENLKPLEDKKHLSLMNKNFVKESVHEFYLLLNSERERDLLSKHLAEFNIESLFHYIPLHTSKKGIDIGRYHGKNITSQVSKQILRLPLHNELTLEEVMYITSKVNDFFYAH